MNIESNKALDIKLRKMTTLTTTGFVVLGFDPNAILNLVGDTYKDVQNVIYLHKDIKAGGKRYTSKIEDAYIFENEEEAESVATAFSNKFKKSEFGSVATDWLAEIGVKQVMGL